MGRSRASRRASVQKAPARSSERSGVLWRALIIAVCAAAVYANSLAGPFVFDDQVSLVDNPQIREWWRLGVLLQPERESPLAGRPLVNLSFAINYAFGGLEPVGYHLVNLALHLACALLIFGIVRRTLDQPALKARLGQSPMTLAWAVGLVWALHPLNSEAVDYVTQRTELMMALCYLGALYAGIRAWASPAPWRWLATSVLTCAMGMACKESMATAPITIICYDAIFLFGSLRQAIRSRWRFYAGLAVSWVVLGAAIWSGPRVHSAGFSSGVSPWTYLLNQTVMIPGYLRLALWPRSLVSIYGWPLPLTLHDVAPYALLMLALFAAACVALVRSPEWGFAGLWFFVTLAPASSVVPIATEVGAERRMYLPLVALVALAVIGVSFIRRVPRIVPGIALAAVSVGLAAGTIARNRDYRSGILLAQTAVDRHPTSVGRSLLGIELQKAGRGDEALVQLRMAVAGAPRAYYPLGIELLRRGRTRDAIEALEAFVREQPLLLAAIDARQRLGQAYTAQERWQEAIEQYRIVFTMKPSPDQRLDTEALLGEALVGAQRFDEAIAQYRTYLKARPGDVHALTYLAVALAVSGQTDESLAAFRQAAELEPDSSSAQRNLAIALFDHRNADEAAVHAARAIALQPGDAVAHDTLGRALAVQGRLPEARAEFERALQIAPDSVDAREDLAKLLRLEVAR
jgi:tetratricopeptide (TPR) repeat protein